MKKINKKIKFKSLMKKTFPDYLKHAWKLYKDAPPRSIPEAIMKRIEDAWHKYGTEYSKVEVHTFKNMGFVDIKKGDQ